MKKLNYWNVALLLLPLVAWGVEMMPGSVLISAPEGVTLPYTVYNYFDQVTEDLIGLCPPVAGLMTCVVFMFAVAYCISKKKHWLTGIWVCAFLGMTVAILPVAFPGEILMVPNVGAPLALGLEALLGYMLSKKGTAQKEQTNKGKRLG